MLIVGISAAYPFAMASVDVGVDPKVISTSVLFAQINVLQSYGLYFALLVPKLMIALLSQVVQFWIPSLTKHVCTISQLVYLFSLIRYACAS
jgi:hypothetical protein